MAQRRHFAFAQCIRLLLIAMFVAAGCNVEPGKPQLALWSEAPQRDIDWNTAIVSAGLANNGARSFDTYCTVTDESNALRLSNDALSRQVTTRLAEIGLNVRPQTNIFLLRSPTLHVAVDFSASASERGFWMASIQLSFRQPNVRYRVDDVVYGFPMAAPTWTKTTLLRGGYAEEAGLAIQKGTNELLQYFGDLYNRENPR